MFQIETYAVIGTLVAVFLRYILEESIIDVQIETFGICS